MFGVPAESVFLVGFSQGERADLLSDLERSRDEARFNDLVSQWRSQKSASRKLREQAKLTETAFQELGLRHGFVVSKDAE